MTERERKRLEMETRSQLGETTVGVPPMRLPAFHADTCQPGKWVPEGGKRRHGRTPFDHWGHSDGGGQSHEGKTLIGTEEGGSDSSRIIIYKQAVFDDVDAMTYRRANVAFAQLPKEVRYELASDSSDPFDKGVLTRHALFWDARLRFQLAFCLDSDSTLGDTDDYEPLSPELIDKTFVYDFNTSLDDNIKASLTEHIHRYLVLGTAYNWYREAGVQSDISEEEMDDLTAKIRALFRTGWVPTPLQPFDPKH